MKRLGEAIESSWNRQPVANPEAHLKPFIQFLKDNGENPKAFVMKALRWRRLQPIARLKSGDHFGEMSLITDTPTSASVKADGRITCLFVPKEKFLEIIDACPTIGRKVLWSFGQTLSARLSETNKRYARALRANERGAA